MFAGLNTVPPIPEHRTSSCYGSFTLRSTDSGTMGTDSDSDFKPDDYIVLCRTCSHCTDSDSDPYSLFLHGV